MIIIYYHNSNKYKFRVDLVGTVSVGFVQKNKNVHKKGNKSSKCPRRVSL